ncbi:MAG TPA: acyltransferase [Pseudonocardiaceae bacterium]|nr:acyltransferase [Pseudonocardiaceae bacterium]
MTIPILADPAASAPSGRSTRLNTLTGLRFFAAIAVVLCHVTGAFTHSAPLTALSSYGYIGVSFFFMLSGFVLTWSAQRGSARRFLWMRFSRVWPLHFLLTMVAFTVLAAHEVLPGPVGHIAEILLLQAWSPQANVYFGGNGVSWSLSCEMLFYLLFPLVAPLLGRLRTRGLTITASTTIAAMVLAPLIATAAHASPDLSYWLFFIFPPYRFGEFLLGMLLARALRLGFRLPKPGTTTAAAVLALAIILFAFTIATVHTGIPIDRPFVALAVLPSFAVLLLAGATHDLARQRTWLNRPIPVRLGEWSFALYLVHKPLFLLTISWGWWHPGLTPLLAFGTLAVALAATLHHAVEKPVERYLRGLA